MFCLSKTGSRRLKKDALPTIFCQGQNRAPNNSSTSQLQSEHCYSNVASGKLSIIGFKYLFNKFFKDYFFFLIIQSTKTIPSFKKHYSEVMQSHFLPCGVQKSAIWNLYPIPLSV